MIDQFVALRKRLVVRLIAIFATVLPRLAPAGQHAAMLPLKPCLPTSLPRPAGPDWPHEIGMTRWKLR